MDFIMTIVEQGLIYGILTLGIYITYKILDFPDLTVDGSFPLGAAVTAALITRGVNPYLTIPIAFLVGVLAGICTGLIHVKCKVRDLLSGIIMMTALYTVNLKIAGTNNVPLFSQETMFKNDMRAVGDNDNLVTALAKDKGNVKILGLAISNGLVALSGCVFAQEQKVFDISTGTGSMVIGLASVIIGTSLFKKLTFVKTTTAVIIGSILYKGCVAIAIRFFDPQSMKLITAVLFLVILVISMERKQKAKGMAEGQKGGKNA